jgi:hypothetical protein
MLDRGDSRRCGENELRWSEPRIERRPTDGNLADTVAVEVGSSSSRSRSRSEETSEGEGEGARA